MTALSEHAFEPRYLQFKRIVRDMIFGDLKPGDRLPSESEFCTSYAVSRTTVREALTALEYEGLIQRKQGIGTFVAPEAAPNDAANHEWPRARNERSYRLISIDLIPADLHVRRPLRLPDPTLVWRLRMTSAGDGSQAAYHVLYLPQELATDLSHVVGKPLVDPFGDLTGMRPYKIDHSVSLARADEYRAAHLSVPRGTPLLLSESLYHTTNKPFAALERIFISRESQMNIVFSEIFE